MTSLNVRMPDDYHLKLKELAELNHRSLNSEVLVALQRYIEQEEEVQKEKEKKKKAVES